MYRERYNVVMCVYVCMCIYIYIYIHTCVYIYIYIYRERETCMSIYIYICIVISIYLPLSLYIYIYIYTHIRMNTCVSAAAERAAGTVNKSTHQIDQAGDVQNARGDRFVITPRATVPVGKLRSGTKRPDPFRHAVRFAKWVGDDGSTMAEVDSSDTCTRQMQIQIIYYMYTYTIIHNGMCWYACMYV